MKAELILIGKAREERIQCQGYLYDGNFSFDSMRKDGDEFITDQPNAQRTQPEIQ